MSGTLVLVRHGQSEWNLKNLFTGWKDPDLTELGIEEAKTGAEALKATGLKFDIAFTSNLIRAQHTLDLIMQGIGQTDLEVIRDEALNERDYGDLAGLNKDDARKPNGARSRSTSGAAPTTCRRPAARASRTPAPASGPTT
jgi:2,3-bisphosphoglycerate-dependent phosphoglycerate mutase